MRETNRTKTVIGLTLGVFLSALESTVVATAMPEIIKDLGGSHLYSLPFSVYMLTATVSSPIWGKLSDLHNRKTIYLWGVLLFLLGSICSGLSQSMTMLIAMRVVQGLGAGCLTPLNFIITADLYPIPERAKIQGYMSGVWGLAGLIGPLVGGLIVDWVNWRYVFYLNLPFGLLALYMVNQNFHEIKKTGKKIKIDWIGNSLFILGASLIVYGLEERQSLTSLLGLTSIIASWYVQQKHPSPILPIKSMQYPTPRIVLFLNLLAGMAFFGILSFLPLYVQTVAQKGATAAGLVLTPMVVGWTLTNIIGGRILAKITLIQLIQWGFCILIFGFTGFTLFYNASIIYLSICGFIIGSGMGFSMLGTILTMQEQSQQEELGSSTAGILFARSIGGSIGVAMLSAIIGDRLLGSTLDLQSGFFDAYVACLGLTVIALFFAFRLKNQNST